MKPRRLNAAEDLKGVSIPNAARFEAVKGDYSFRTNRRRRTCFGRRDGHDFDVKMVDYR